MSDKEKEVFDQELSSEELKKVAGGGRDDNGSNCTQYHTRPIGYGSSFPNCAATVEADSWCGKNDACFHEAVKYMGMRTCDRSWK